MQAGQRGAAERTVAEALREATAALAAAGIERGRVEAEILLAHVLRARRLDLLASPERVLTGQEAEAFDRLVARRATRYPLPYLTGEREFMVSSFTSTRMFSFPARDGVMVEAAIEALRGWVAAKDGSGTGFGGAGGVMSAPALVHCDHLATSCPRRVLATDISPEACAVAG